MIERLLNSTALLWHARRIAARKDEAGNVLGHHTAGRDNAALSYTNAWQDNAVCANPDIVTDYDRLDTAFGVDPAAGLIERQIMPRAVKYLRVRSNQAIPADGDALVSVYTRTVDPRPVTDDYLRPSPVCHQLDT